MRFKHGSAVHYGYSVAKAIHYIEQCIDCAGYFPLCFQTPLQMAEPQNSAQYSEKEEISREEMPVFLQTRHNQT